MCLYIYIYIYIYIFTSTTSISSTSTTPHSAPRCSSWAIWAKCVSHLRGRPGRGAASPIVGRAASGALCEERDLQTSYRFVGRCLAKHTYISTIAHQGMPRGAFS